MLINQSESATGTSWVDAFKRACMLNPDGTMQVPDQLSSPDGQILTRLEIPKTGLTPEQLNQYAQVLIVGGIPDPQTKSVKPTALWLGEEVPQNYLNSIMDTKTHRYIWQEQVVKKQGFRRCITTHDSLQPSLQNNPHELQFPVKINAVQIKPGDTLQALISNRTLAQAKNVHLISINPLLLNSLGLSRLEQEAITKPLTQDIHDWNTKLQVKAIFVPAVTA